MRRAVLSLCAMLALTGCVATQKDILDLSQQTDSMNLQVHQLKKIMSSLQSNQADLGLKLEQLNSEMSVLNESLKDNRDAMSRLSSKIDDVGAVLGHKFTKLDGSIARTRQLLTQREEKEAAESEQRRLEEEARRKKEEEEAQKAAGPTPSQIFNKARIQLSQEQYDGAADGFKLYVAEYPQGEFVDQATYYLGQVRYAQEQWQLAARNFATVLDRYPKSDFTPAARLRYALCLIKMKSHLEEARRYLESIPEDFPHTPEANKAADMLRQWKEAPEEAKPSEKSSAGPAGAPAKKKS